MIALVEPTCVFRTAAAADAERALERLQKRGIPATTYVELAPEALLEHAGAETSPGDFIHTIWTSAAEAHAAAGFLERCGFASTVESEPANDKPSNLAHYRFMALVAVAALIGGIVMVIKNFLR
jgi:hypothetical protein